LQQLQMRVLNLIYYANIAQHQHSPTPTSYYTIRQNIVTLQKDYQSYIQSVDDEHYLSYIYALDARMKGAILLLDLLISVLDTGSTIAPEKMLLQINETLRQINDASQLARICTYNSFYTSSLREGIQKDLIVAHIIAVVVSSFEVVTRTQAEEFKTFYKRLMQYVSSLASVQSAKHLLWLLTSVGRVLSAQLGDDPLHVLKDWSWLETAVEANRLKATFGMSAGETARVVGLHYHPYWIARISYSLVSGVLVRKASEHEGFLLMDATSADALSVTPVIETDPALPFVELGAQSLQLLDRQIISLPAVLTRDMAEQALKAYKHAHEGDLKILATSVLGILYLPAASVCYTAKNKQRTIILGHLSGINQQLEQVLKQTQNFLRIHV
jgi:hypothetical protein